LNEGYIEYADFECAKCARRLNVAGSWRSVQIQCAHDLRWMTVVKIYKMKGDEIIGQE